MALYQITVDCRIANKDYKKGDVVSHEEVEYFPSVMQEVTWKPTLKVETPKAPEVEEAEENSEEENSEEETTEEEEEEKPVKANKKRSKKK